MWEREKRTNDTALLQIKEESWLFMAIKLSDLKKRTKKVSIDFQKDTLEIEYYINVITPAFLRAKMEIPEQLTEAIAGWDLVDDAGKVIPVSLDVMVGLPVEMQTVLINAITNDMRTAGDEEKNA